MGLTFIIVLLEIFALIGCSYIYCHFKPIIQIARTIRSTARPTHVCPPYTGYTAQCASEQQGQQGMGREIHNDQTVNRDMGNAINI